MALTIESVSGQVMNVVVIIVGIIFSGAFGIALVFFIRRLLRYNHKVIIFEEDEHGKITNITHPKIDKGGVFIDRSTNLKLFFLKKNKAGLKPDKIPYISMGKEKIVFLVQRGLRNFSFCRFPSGISSNPGNVQLQVYDEDVSWAINAYNKSKKVFNQSLLLQYMPYIAMGVTSFVILIIFMWLFKKFDVIVEASRALKEAAIAIAQSKAGTTVVGG